MKRSILMLLLSVGFCLALTETSHAQNTLAYATVDYDEETNTIYGYAYTEPDYQSGIYYRTTHVTAKLRDGSHNELAFGTKQITGARAEVYLEAPGNGNPPYKIQSGHVVLQSYYVYNHWDPRNYRYTNGYLDYYYYTHYLDGGGGPIIDIPLYFEFGGRRPEAVRGSPNITLGQLLTSALGALGDGVTFTTLNLEGAIENFSFNNATVALDQTLGGSGYCYGGASNQFNLTIDFQLPSDATSVFMDGQSFVGENPKSQFQRASNLTFSNISLTDPKTGRVSFNVFRKRPASDFSDNKVRVTIAGRRSGGGSYTSTARIKLTCP